MEPSGPQDIANVLVRPVSKEGPNPTSHSPLRAQESKLLSLPPEMRNAIYEFALLEPERINITPATRMPPLIQACRQVRVETRSIWLLSNKFRVSVRDCDHKLMAAFDLLAGTACPRKADRIDNIVHLCGKPHWENLVRWTKDVYRRKACKIKAVAGERRGPLTGALGAAHALAETAPSWIVCEAALAQLRMAIGHYDSRWLT